jgi:hypothetical protein
MGETSISLKGRNTCPELKGQDKATILSTAWIGVACKNTFLQGFIIMVLFLFSGYIYSKSGYTC